MTKFETLIQSDQFVLVDFFATWCGPCKMQDPVLEDVKAQLQDEITIIKIDVDKNQALTAQYSTQYNMRGVPTLLLFRAGKLLWKQSGYTDKQTLLHYFNEYKNKY
ncbi:MULTISPECIES: thioredoxin [Myroides]|jgi:thioredoxin 1|nr:thioredoxin [Myroides odoratus]MDH6602565.1 thioredoxin 1 [Myroides gitamensis]EHQ42280.1 thioredoxin [Myroides odoratus DSM 2801]EKB09430.1 thioredoxin [Myroides odoratus CIP 103059]MCS4239939.1 thioredoxin 1 [Myroides odoratus]MDR0224231.1 thioredoxin [Myroides odoratus]